MTDLVPGVDLEPAAGDDVHLVVHDVLVAARGLALHHVAPGEVLRVVEVDAAVQLLNNDQRGKKRLFCKLIIRQFSFQSAIVSSFYNYLTGNLQSYDIRAYG